MLRRNIYMRLLAIQIYFFHWRDISGGYNYNGVMVLRKYVSTRVAKNRYTNK